QNARDESERAGAAEIDLSDGVKLAWPDGWVHIRASNTESMICIIGEAKSGRVNCWIGQWTDYEFYLLQDHTCGNTAGSCHIHFCHPSGMTLMPAILAALGLSVSRQSRVICYWAIGIVVLDPMNWFILAVGLREALGRVRKE